MKRLIAMFSMFALVLFCTVESHSVTDQAFACEQVDLSVGEFESAVFSVALNDMQIPAASMTILPVSDVLFKNVTAQSTVKRKCVQEANSYG